MKKMAVALAIVAFTLLYTVFPTYGEPANDELIDVEIAVQILDINQSQKTAELELIVLIADYPYNLTQVEVRVFGAGDLTISCYNTGHGIPDKWYYQGKSKQTTWLLEGRGEAFPFDSYKLRFRVGYLTYFSPKASSLKVVSILTK